MFNSISDWIKLPQQVQIPTVNMPKIPEIFGKKADVGATAADGAVAEQSESNKQMMQEAGAGVSAAPPPPPTTTSTSSIPTTSAAAAESGDAAADHEKKNQHHQIKIPIDIDASKAIGQAKEIGTNIGSM